MSEPQQPMEGVIYFPCIECDCTILYPIPGYDLCECHKCGHPQDKPTPDQQQAYDNL